MCLVAVILLNLSSLGKQALSSSSSALGLPHRCLRLSLKGRLSRNQYNEASDDQGQKQREPRYIEVALGPEQSHASLHFAIQMGMPMLLRI